MKIQMLLKQIRKRQRVAVLEMNRDTELQLPPGAMVIKASHRGSAEYMLDYFTTQKKNPDVLEIWCQGSELIIHVKAAFSLSHKSEPMKD